MSVRCAVNMILVFSLTLTSGCIIQSRQLNSLIELFEEPPINLSASGWSLRYLDYESTVYAVSTEKGILFSNDNGDQVLFDGWVLRLIRGMGRRNLNISIYDVSNVRVFKRGNTVLSKHICDQWGKKKSSEIVRFFQYCSDRQGYKNTILVQADGNISVIRQIVDERYTPLTLIKIK